MRTIIDSDADHDEDDIASVESYNDSHFNCNDEDDDMECRR